MAKEPAPIFDGPIGGESWKYEPRSMPWDRPPQFADSEDALKFTFKRLTNPKLSKQLLSLLEAGMPIDFVVEGILMQGFMQGKYGAPAMTMMVGPLTIILWRMAESAGIQPRTSSDIGNKVDFDPAELLAAEKRIQNNTMNKAIVANEKSGKELTKKDVMNRQGFIKFRPKTMTRSGA